jgi:two-component system, cell cycle sensor histidine kinase and response regulator CckA
MSRTHRAGDHLASRVLIVEDEGSDAVVLTHALAGLGVPHASIFQASSLAEALSRLASDRPTLAIVDLGLPDSEGPDTVRQLRARAPDLPLIVISGAADSVAAARSLQEGADDYLVKGDFDARALDRAVRHAGERRRLWTEARLKTLETERAERRLRAVIEANADGMLIVDRAGVVRFSNESARALFGRPGESLVGVSLGLPDMNETDAVEMDVPERADGPVRLELRARPMEWEGAPARLVVLRDVTMQRQLEERLRQSQKMEALGKLTGGIAHDFNNVLAVILNGTDVLAELVPAELTEARTELREIEVSARRAAGMVRRLLGFSRKEYLRFETLDVRAFTSDALSLVRRMLDDRVRLEHVFEEGIGEIRADPAALQQIFLNVAANARDAMPEGGTLSMSVGRMALDESHRQRHPWVRPGIYERISIQDTGIGMPDDVVTRIFEPFFTTKGPEAGTGLGMAMVYGLMKQHRGLVHVESEPGRGTRVDLYFPDAHQEDRAEPVLMIPERKPVGDVAARGSETLLVVEDEPALRRAMARVLGAAGYVVLLAADGREGLEVYERERDRIDMVVSDLVMPQLGGREVLAELRRADVRIPLLLVTGYGVEYVEELRDEHVSMLTKPWSRDTLLGAVRSALDKRRYVGAGAAR